MIYYIGIDDTDNNKSRGTGYKARLLGESIKEKKLGILKSITRHQLFFHPDVPYTSHNSSACLIIDSENAENLKNFCIEFLKKEAEQGSDAGLCICESSKIHTNIQAFGYSAKRKIVTQNEAKKIASENKLFLEGYTGNKDGIIGALAAVGLCASGNDGRFIFLKGLRQIKSGIYSASELLSNLDIDNIANIDGLIANESDYIFVSDWIRPVLKNHQKILVVEKVEDYDNYQWETAGRNFIRNIS